MHVQTPYMLHVCYMRGPNMHGPETCMLHATYMHVIGNMHVTCMLHALLFRLGGDSSPSLNPSHEGKGLVLLRVILGAQFKILGSQSESFHVTWRNEYA